MATRTCYDRFNRPYRCYSGWSNWGRWVLLGVLIFVFILAFFMCSCLSARRRRKAGRTPMYGTGWAATGAPPAYQPNYNQQQPYNSGYNNQTNQGGHYGANAGYYGGQDTTSYPQNTYGGNENSYAPPPGPPPNKVV